MDEIIKQILDEVERAEKKHPHWPIGPIHQAAIVCEESGELIRSALQFEYEGGNKDEMKTEAIHTAATCIRFLKNLKYE